MLKAFRGKVASMYDVPERIADVIYNISNVLVLLGAVGGIGIFWAGGIREKFAALREADNNRKIAEANEVAAIANKAAGQANQRAAEANGEAARANEGLANSNLEIEKRQKENLELARKFEAERIERLSLEKSLAPRASLLTAEVRSSLLATLRKLPRASVWVQLSQSTPEAAELYEALGRLVADAGCLAGHDEFLPVGASPYGLIVLHPQGVDDAAAELHNALVNAGFPDVRTEVADGLGGDWTAKLIVAAKK
jgi:hypothetical protein